MVRVEVLRWLAIGQGVIAAFLVALVCGHALWDETFTRRWRERRDAASAALAGFLAGHGGLEAAATAAAALPRGAQRNLLAGIARSVRGTERERVAAVARAVGLAPRAARQCRSRRRVTRLRGVRLCADLGLVPVGVPALLRDRWAPVRAEAARLASVDPTPPRLRSLLTLLTDPAPLVRFAAKDTLGRCGAAAAEPLADWLASEITDPVALADALDVAVPLAGPAFAPAVRRFRSHPDARVRARVAPLAAGVADEESIACLVAFLDDPEAAVRARAVAGLGRLGHWPDAPRIARRLRDPAWAVRRAAGLALRRLGAPGELLLRRALDDEDAFARDMARQVFDLPDLRAVG